MRPPEEPFPEKKPIVPPPTKPSSFPLDPSPELSPPNPSSVSPIPLSPVPSEYPSSMESFEKPQLYALVKHVEVTEAYKDEKLGTKFCHKENLKAIYELRRYTDPKTLVGTMYLFNRDTLERIYKLNPEEWIKY
jgi:hypothetical protein